jgi:hypothetical protein
MKIAKAIVAAVGGLCTALAPLLADDIIGAGEWPPDRPPTAHAPRARRTGTRGAFVVSAG